MDTNSGWKLKPAHVNGVVDGHTKLLNEARKALRMLESSVSGAKGDRAHHVSVLLRLALNTLIPIGPDDFMKIAEDNPS